MAQRKANKGPKIKKATALAVISEIGTDMSRFPTEKNFTSWLGLCPGTRITGAR